MSTVSYICLILSVLNGTFAQLDCDSSSESSVELLQVSTSLVANATAESHLVSRNTAARHDHRPVFFMHGLGGYVHSCLLVIAMLKQFFPTRKLISLDLFNLMESFDTPLYTQMNTIISTIRSTIADEPAAFVNGYDLVGHSIGGLLMRTVVENMDDHKVNTLISLAGVQGGHYCTEYPCLPMLLSKAAVANIYNPDVQATSSFANVYRDIQSSVFLEGNVFLPVLDGLLEDADNQRRKSNFLRLKHAILIGGVDGPTSPNPPASQFFEFYAENDSSTITPLSEQPVYAQDTFGLRTLDKDGRLRIIKVPGVDHLDWLRNESVIREYVLPLFGVGTLKLQAGVHGKQAAVQGNISESSNI